MDSIKTKNISHFFAFVLMVIFSLMFTGAGSQKTLLMNIVTNIFFIAFFFVHAFTIVPLLVKKLEVKKYIIVAFSTFIFFAFLVVLTIKEFYGRSLDWNWLSNFDEKFYTLLFSYIFSLIYGIFIIDREYRSNLVKKVFDNDKQKLSILILHVIVAIIALIIISYSIFDEPEINGRRIWAGVYITLLFVGTVYIFSLKIIPGLIQKKTFGKYLAVAILSILIFGALFTWFDAIWSSSIISFMDGTPITPKDFLYFGKYLESLLFFIPIGLISVLYYLILFFIKRHKIRKKPGGGFRLKHLVHLVIFIFIATFSLMFIGSSSHKTLSMNVVTNAIIVAFFFVHALTLVPLLIKKLEIKKYIIAAFISFVLFGILIIFSIINSDYYREFNPQGGGSFDLSLLPNFGEEYFTILLTYIFSLIYGVFVIDKEYRNNFVKKVFDNNMLKMSIFILHVFVAIVALVIVTSSVLNVPEIRGSKMWAGVYSSLLWVVTVYVFSFMIIPGLIRKRTFGRYLVITSGAILIFGLLDTWFEAIDSAAITHHIDGTPSVPKDFFNFDFFMFSLLKFIPIGFISAFYYMTIFLITRNSNYSSNIIGKRDAELRLLKSQVNPHFLFNSLNIIYATALEEGSGKTAETTSKLSNLIRYMMEDINLDFIPLEKEIKYVQDYINIQLSRCSAIQNVEIKIENIEDKQISPGLLISFIENAFKYGINPSKTSYMSVEIGGRNGEINFECKNSINKNKTNKESGLGIGIKNVKQRLALIYPQRHNLEIEDNDDFFTVKLNIFAE